MKTLGWTLATIGGVAMLYVAYGASMFLFQEWFMFHPGPRPPPPAETEAPELRPVTATSADGLTLTSWYAPPPGDGTGPVVVYFQGNGGNWAQRLDKARFFLDNGLGMMMVGQPGYNGNPGHPGEAAFLDAGRAALGILEAEGIGPARRVFYGESIGSGSALPLAADHGAAAVVLEGAFTSIADMVWRQYYLFMIDGLLRHPFDNMDDVRRLDAPLLALRGGRDRVVPPSMGKTLVEAARAAGNPQAKDILFPEGGHVNLFDVGAGPRVLAFLSDTGVR
ncbi:alpha/beta hydrolase [Roseospira visakhapatnamensis]|uniref:Alpha/beta hydrolase n=1 Tax=Roseospira visakhapatnamensis TaxID=390880 RepID=A0A7W6RCK2_9PROT|nr:alpha/beta hydrolase [Roseospira visakhapatnamensis]MBB4265920.1 hypothetical protein [Roseospira visakhapatnamensis]